MPNFVAVVLILAMAGYTSADSEARGPALIRLPWRLGLMPMSVFNSKIVGKNMHVMISGLHPSNAESKLEKAELQFTRPRDGIVSFQFKAVLQDSCVYESFFGGNDFDTFYSGNRAEFKVSSTGTYAAVFSSNPDSYAWVVICLRHEAGTRRCPATNLITSLYTIENPPNNINLEMMGRDLRQRMYMNMEEIIGEFTFVYTQGTNTCPPDTV